MSREQFEAWWEINYHNGNPPRFGWAAWREDGGYKIDDDESELDAMWNAWQAATNAIEAKCAALAAENAALKFYLRNGPVIRKGGELAAAHQFAPETPATDTFLAEVQAQGAEMAAIMLNRNHPIMSEAADAIISRAKQLRQEAAQ